MYDNLYIPPGKYINWDHKCHNGSVIHCRWDFNDIATFQITRSPENFEKYKSKANYFNIFRMDSKSDYHNLMVDISDIVYHILENNGNSIINGSMAFTIKTKFPSPSLHTENISTNKNFLDIGFAFDTASEPDKNFISRPTDNFIVLFNTATEKDSEVTVEITEFNFEDNRKKHIIGALIFGLLLYFINSTTIPSIYNFLTGSTQKPKRD